MKLSDIYKQKLRLPALVLSWVFLFLACSVPVAAENGVSPGREAVSLNAAQLFEMARKSLETGDRRQAARYFIEVYEKHPFEEESQAALWEAANLYKTFALAGDKDAWETARNLFRYFSTDYPDSPHAQRAYLEIAIAHHHMKLMREALIYTKLFKERYPDSELIDLADYWKARTLAAIDRTEEAESLLKKLVASADEDVAFDASVALGNLYYKIGNYPAALNLYKKIINRLSSHSEEYLDVLRLQGRTMVRMQPEKKVESGRKLLFYYTNMDTQSPHRAEAFFDLAESYLRSDDSATAQRLYEKALEAAKEDSRIAVLSRFRRAEFRDNPKRKLAKWEKRGDLADPQGDIPYKRAIEAYGDEPIAQDARYGLMIRHIARNEKAAAYEVGREYVKHKGGDFTAEVYEILGEILVERFEKLLAGKDYQKIYSLYQSEHEIISNYKKGDLLYLVGRALEAMYLYDQASVVYYRSLGLPLDEEMKKDLYYRRARVYIANNDLAAAGRLLKYLRNIYEDNPDEAEVLFLSGRLALAHGKEQEARNYFDKALKEAQSSSRKKVYAAAKLKLLLEQKAYETFESFINEVYADKILTPQDQQEFYLALGDYHRKRADFEKAATYYGRALEEGTPQEGEQAQLANMHMGDMLFKLGKSRKGREYLLLAINGENPLWAKAADEKLKQYEIDRALSEVKQFIYK